MDPRRKIETTMRVVELSDEERTILKAMMDACYAENGAPLGQAGAMSAEELAARVYGLSTEPLQHQEYKAWRKDMDTHKRKVRYWVNRLIIKHHIPIMCQAGRGGGYYLPSGSAEVEANRWRFFDRAMTGLMKSSRSVGAYAEGMVQLTMGIHGERGKQMLEKYDAGGSSPENGEADKSEEEQAAKDAVPAWVRVVTGIIDNVAKTDPDMFQSQLRKLQQERGDIFVRQDKVKELRVLSRQLQTALEGL